MAHQWNCLILLICGALQAQARHQNFEDISTLSTVFESNR